MKKKALMLAAGIALAVFPAKSQTIENALDLSTNDLTGTARSIAMGNALTAVGSDVGSVIVNPAGSAVAAYSQAVITPGLFISSTGAAFAPACKAIDGPVFGEISKTSRTNFAFPSVGAVIVYDLGTGYGLKSLSFGLVSNRTATYNYRWDVSGTSGITSISGLLAEYANAEKMNPMILSSGNLWNGGGWPQRVAYKGGMISYNKDGDFYFGSAETVDKKDTVYNCYVKGDLKDRVIMDSEGYKNDLLINFGLNFDDKVYVGANVGITTMYQSTKYAVHEVPVDMNQFQNKPSYYSSKGEWCCSDVMRKFSGHSYIDEEVLSSTGVYGKLGAIYLPNDWLRLGLAVRTPTLHTVRQTYQTTVRTEYNEKSDDEFSASANTPSDAGSTFKLNSAWGFDAGIAATIGTRALISVDYELMDYSHMDYRYNNRRVSYNDPFGAINDDIREWCGVAHNVRAGAEVNVMPWLALRAGFNLRTNPLKDESRRLDNMMAYSFGLGYLSAGSFFADAAVKYTKNNRTMLAYGDYIPNYYSPTIKIFNNFWSVSVTLGWRF